MKDNKNISWLFYSLMYLAVTESFFGWTETTEFKAILRACFIMLTIYCVLYNLHAQLI